MSVDWGVGHYESTAERLLPAAVAVVEAADIRPGERVLDVGCGTGNAALLAAERGAVVVGVDPAERLLEVARARAQHAGREIELVTGTAGALPVAPGSYDAVLSVFAAVFAPDADEALAGMARATAPDGRIVLSAWIPGNAISRMNEVVLTALREETGAPPPAGGVAWHDRAQVTELARRHGLVVSSTEHTIAFTDSSPEHYLDGEADNHPLALSARAVLGPRGRWDEVHERALAELVAGNEDPAAFRVTSRYVILTLQRG